MTRNEILTLFRHRKVERGYARQQMEKSLSMLPDSSMKVTTTELVEMIDIAIERMPELRKRIFMMSRYDEMTYAEIAQHLNISPRTVQYHIGKALNELRKLMDVMVLFV